MYNVRTRRRLAYFAAIGLVAGATLCFAKPAIIAARAQSETNETQAAPATVRPAADSSAVDLSHTFHVYYKNGTQNYVLGDALTVEDGSYVIKSNVTGVSQTVAVFSPTSVESVVAYSTEVTVPDTAARK